MENKDKKRKKEAILLCKIETLLCNKTLTFSEVTHLMAIIHQHITKQDWCEMVIAIKLPTMKTKKKRKATLSHKLGVMLYHKTLTKGDLTSMLITLHYNTPKHTWQDLVKEINEI